MTKVKTRPRITGEQILGLLFADDLFRGGRDMHAKNEPVIIDLSNVIRQREQDTTPRRQMTPATRKGRSKAFYSARRIDRSATELLAGLAGQPASGRIVNALQTIRAEARRIMGESNGN